MSRLKRTGERLASDSDQSDVYVCPAKERAGMKRKRGIGTILLQHLSRIADANRGCGAIEHPPALLEGSGVQSAELGEFVRQALGSRR